ncbi:MAG: carboxypeptidase-like regulatory domain-containing protein [Chitinophaga sp.]|uniref:hypothetical protein n=1 Tax=Chitinophaga sp. TaxID=1869181 RepID=UPI0025C0313A|nr:hypothetical protein [Chitinophaga sp.]MBV8251295.1 carboxypeptidase-like regulatory domain-containing protein [Chitinophaga sp.]
MSESTLVKKVLLILLLVLIRFVALAQQVQVSGTVYEKTATMGLSGVSVHSNSGAGAVTDSLGRYTIKIPRTDSLSFSYQGKSTQKFAVREINLTRPFDMKLLVEVKTLATVEVKAKPKSYQYDSLENRREYRKYFDFHPEYITSGNGGAGINLDALFSIGKIKRMQQFRKFLQRDEQEKYVDYRFNKDLVQKITGLKSPLLESFMVAYRPTYAMLMSFENDYDYLRYIKEMGSYYESEVHSGRTNIPVFNR